MLRVQVVLDTNKYETGVTISDEEMQQTLDSSAQDTSRVELRHITASALIILST